MIASDSIISRDGIGRKRLSNVCAVGRVNKEEKLHGTVRHAII
jgi:hypothetical protein